MPDTTCGCIIKMMYRLFNKLSPYMQEKLGTEICKEMMMILVDDLSNWVYDCYDSKSKTFIFHNYVLKPNNGSGTDIPKTTLVHLWWYLVLGSKSLWKSVGF